MQKISCTHGKFRSHRLCAGSCRLCGWTWKHLAISVSCGKIRRRYVSACLSDFNGHFWICYDRIRNSTGTYDEKKKPGWSFPQIRKELPFHLGGWINAVIPMMIVPYYSVIGGWVLKYLFEYIRGNANLVAQDGYFNSFITSSMEVEIWFLIFAALVFIVILAGVKNGVERVSKVMMPLLILLAACVAVYSITRPGAVEGIKYFLIPNLENFSWMTVVAAMGQMFYSLSIAMGILYTYGSYIGKDVDIEKSTTQVEIFDTGVALLAGLMIIPAVFAFSGGDMETLQQDRH